MGRLRNLFFIICASLALVSCSYFDTESGGLDVSSARPMAETIDLTADRAPVSSIPVDLTQAVSGASKGSVQVYSLDGPGYTSPVPSMPVLSSAAPMDLAPLQQQPAPTPSVSGPSEQDAPSEAFLLDREMLQMLGGTMQEQPKHVEPVPEAPPVSRYAALDQAIPVFSPNRSVQIFSLDDPLPGASMSDAGPLMPEMTAGPDNSRKLVIFFEHDSATLTPEALAGVQEVAKHFNPAERRGLTVEGHASARASSDNAKQRHIVNLQVSMDRAFAVSRALIEGGVPPEAIRVAAWGDTHPPLENYGKSQEDAARRVEISD